MGNSHKNILSGTSSSIKTKLRWNSHWMVLFQNGVRQLRSPAKMATTVQLRCYWKQLWSRWAITDSWEPLVMCSSVFSAYVDFHISIFFSQITWLNVANLCRDIAWMVLDINYHFNFIWKFNMAARPIMLSNWLFW